MPQIMPWPSERAIKEYLLDRIRHIMHVEYYFSQLDIDPQDGQRPHDANGKYNKLSSCIINGFSWEFEVPLTLPQEKTPDYVRRTIELHRQGQIHHQKWDLRITLATDEDMIAGSIDTYCAMREPRPHNGGPHSDEQIDIMVQQLQDYKIPWLRLVLKEVKKIRKPELSIITLEQIIGQEPITNIGVPDDIYAQTAKRLEEAKASLRSVGYKL
jgi:hypothetical protein